MGTQDRSRATVQRGRNEIVSISGALEGNEQLARQQIPGVVVCTVERYVLIFLFNSAAAPCGSLLECDSSH
jgi:hypothetical protein